MARKTNASITLKARDLHIKQLEAALSRAIEEVNKRARIMQRIHKDIGECILDNPNLTPAERKHIKETHKTANDHTDWYCDFAVLTPPNIIGAINLQLWFDETNMEYHVTQKVGKERTFISDVVTTNPVEAQRLFDAQKKELSAALKAAQQ